MDSEQAYLLLSKRNQSWDPKMFSTQKPLWTYMEPSSFGGFGALDVDLNSHRFVYTCMGSGNGNPTEHEDPLYISISNQKRRSQLKWLAEYGNSTLEMRAEVCSLTPCPREGLRTGVPKVFSTLAHFLKWHLYQDPLGFTRLKKNHFTNHSSLFFYSGGGGTAFGRIC